ncbi:MAG: phosphatidylserine decarboxylase, partial [Bacteroidota bacterium]
MFRLHKEGNQTILITSLVLLAINLLTFNFLPEGSSWIWIGLTGSIVIYLLVLQFFRNPVRDVIEINDDFIYAPADGKVVVIEKTTEKEYFKDE